MSFSNYLLLGLVYYIGSASILTLGVGFFTLNRPIFAGLLAGLVLGEPQLGLLVGAVANLLFADYKSSKRALDGDPVLMGIIAAVLAVRLSITPAAALAIAFPFSLIGLAVSRGRLNFNQKCAHILKIKMGKRFTNGLTKYNILIPQVFLLGLTVTSASVILLVTYSLSATALGMLPKLEIAFNTVGILLVMLAAASATLWFKSRYNILIFAIAYLVSVFLSFDIYLVLIVLLLFSIQKLAVKDSEKRKQKRIQNKDLIKSWFIWMNFSDSCFNFEFAQGISFCQSIKPALNRIYKGDREGREAATIRHFDFFKGDPILSTSVIGHMIGVEEKKASDKRIKEITIADAKKGAMGAIASTEVMERQSAVAAIIILGMIYGVVSNEISFFVLSTLIMIGMTHYLSLKNMFDGYFLGEDGIIKSVNRINEIRIFKHAGKIFVIMLGLVVGEAIFNMLYSIQATNFRNGAASLLILFVLFNYLIRKNIKIELIVLALYGLNIVLLMFI